jgi:hypothetical protein
MYCMYICITADSDPINDVDKLTIQTEVLVVSEMAYGETTSKYIDHSDMITDHRRLLSPIENDVLGPSDAFHFLLNTCLLHNEFLCTIKQQKSMCYENKVARAYPVILTVPVYSKN